MNRNLEPIKDEPDFKRDPNTGAVINVNNKALQAYRAKKEQNRKVNQIESDMESVKQELVELKALLQNIVDKNGE